MTAWDRVPLAMLIREAKPGFACGDQDEDGIFQIRMNNVTKHGELDLTKRRRVPRSAPGVEKSRLEPGDVLFNATNSPELVGKTLYFPELDEEVVYSNHFQRIRTKSELLDSYYLSKWLSYQFSLGVFAGLCKRWVNQATVSKESLLALKVPLPPVAVQRRIAAVLDQVDSQRAKRREAIALVDDLAQSVFLDLFGGKWSGDRVRLGECLDFITSGGRGWAKYYSDEGARFIRSLDVQMNEVTLDRAVFVTPPENAEARRTRVRKGDVLLTITGSLIGRVAAVPDVAEGSYVSQHVAILRPATERLRPGFLARFLSLPSEGQRQISKAQYGQTKPGLNFEQIENFMIPLPEISEQERLLRRLAALDEVRARHRVHLATLDELSASIQQRAFSGRLWEREAA
ncbi:restriction endonuclease subunit S [Streptomyces sp. CC208A]|uniref:restriction endonuclease subunit S n=1 Tax=Streptomyces sp. CC208A TaxID=3044573 RepID=UPI0024A96A34|nr:restriction endonuclease subunit S [Streptomyces sp. CC208A]